MNAIIPLAYTLQDQRLKDNIHQVVDTILERVQPDGWIGPETVSEGKRMIWARTLLFLGLTNLVDANSTYQQPIVSAMHRFNGLMNSMLKDNGTGMIHHEGDKVGADDYVWFRARTEDMVVSLQWLLDHYPGNQTTNLKENIQMIHHFGYKWEDWYTEGSYIKENLYNLPQSVTDDQWQFLHGVTIAESELCLNTIPGFHRLTLDKYQGLKYAAVLRRSTLNDSLLTTAKNGVRLFIKPYLERSD